MKRMRQWLAVGIAASLSACAAFDGKPLVLPTVGPAPLETPAAKGQGFLAVYSAWSYDANFFNRPTDYILISDDGKMDRPIRNQSEAFDQRPALVALPAGRYQVIARSETFGRIKVPVLIQESRTTFVYLDIITQPRVAGAETNKLVRLPDGSIVGWAAEAGVK
jgi:hypothetical protein